MKMMKIILIFLFTIISINAYSESSTIVKIYPTQERVPKNMDLTFSSYHEFALKNSSNGAIEGDICAELVSCQNYPIWAKKTADCHHYNLLPGQTDSGNRVVSVTVNYPFAGECLLNAKTEIFGNFHSLSTDQTKFTVR